tara:strand:+ start:1786 stop:6273 length:4488 start_codon:yes stop_codon:yes gene_type:complete
MATAGLCMLALTMTAPRRPRVAVCFAATTKNSNVKNYEQTPMARLSIPSTKRTASRARIYVGIDDDDILMMKWKDVLEKEATVVVVSGKKNRVPFNEVTKKAYDDGADYIVRINDDTRFTTEGWVIKGINALKSMDPPNVGVVAPVCKQGNTNIFTHDMVHRTHLEIFGEYYPSVFDNWFLDDWITLVYRPGRSKRIEDWEVHHEVKMTRYAANRSQKRLLNGEVCRGREKMREWFKMHDKPVGVRFQIHVLAMNRANSLQRLLRSLEKADYNNDCVHLHIHIDDSTDNKKCVEVAESFKFSHGNVVVDVAKQNNGLRDSWFKAWRPSDNERAIILEDDVELSSQWYKWLKKAWESCDGRDDLAGISLQRQTLVPKEPSAHREIVNNHEPFLYRLVGSIGFSPHWKQWRAFLEWIDSVDTSTVNIATPGLITSDWFNTLDKRHMWTQYFIWFCDQHDLYTLYVNLPGGKTLAAHMREKGKHYERTEGRDFALASEVALAFPDRFMKYDWDGKAESSKHVITTVVSSSLLNMAKNWWHYLAPYSESISVHIIGLSEGICHHFEGENVVCTYAQTTEQDYADNEVVYRSPGYNKNVKRKLLEYSNFLEDMRIGTTVLFSDVDVVYLSNPFDAITTNLNLGFSGGSQGKKCHVLLNTGVFFVVKTESNNTMFRRAIQNLESGKSYDGGDQGAIQAAVNELRLEFVRLPCDTFVNGNGLFTIKTSKTPVSIHMNWITKSGTKKKCFEACRLWMNNTKNFIRTAATLLPSGVVRDCKKQLVIERWGGAPVHILPSVLNDAPIEHVGHLKIDPRNSGRNLLNANRETKYTSNVDMCLTGKPFGRAANQMLSMFGALPAKGTLGLDNRWSAFYADWFEPNRRINLFFKGRCKNSTNPQDAFYSLKNDYNSSNRNFEGFQMKNELLQKASGILASYDGAVATVHGRWLENECTRRARTLNNWCTEKNETWEHTCHYTHSSVFKLLPADIKHILYISDGQTLKYAKTFKKVDSHAFNIQFAMMSLSDYHFGNPMSTIDYIVSKLRQNKPTYPERCYATSFEAGVERKTNSNDKSWVILLTVNAGYIDLFLNFFHWFEKLKLDNRVVVIAEDERVFVSLEQMPWPSNVKVHKSKLIVEEAPMGDWNTLPYNNIVSKRPTYILDMLKLGEQVLYADIDSVWLSSPLKHWDDRADIMYAMDQKNRNRDKPDNYCSGLLFVIPNERTISFFKDWQSLQKGGKERNQHGFNDLLRAHKKMRQKLLPEKAFPAGHMYFDRGQREGVVVVHNNFIIGHDAKVARFKAHNLWHEPFYSAASLRNFHDRFSGGGMTRPEQELLARMYANAESVFEWGMGSSTLIAAHVGNKRLTAVDSAPTWVDKVRGMLNRPTYMFRHADIGPVIQFGNPKDQSRKDQWPDYSLQVTREPEPYDVYLVDGRFRVACACQALLHGRADSLVLVHDFFRDEYQVLLTLADKVEQGQMLAVLRRKTTTSDADIKAVWEKYKFIKS